MVGSTTHYHETKEGELKVTINPLDAQEWPDWPAAPGGAQPKVDNNTIAVQLEFKCAGSGVMYDASIPRSILINICILFRAFEEIRETFVTSPTITVESHAAVAHWIAPSKTRTYPVDIVMKRREGPKDTELRAENAALLDRVARLEIRMEQMDAANKKCISDLSILAALSYHDVAVAPRMIFAPLSYNGRSIIRHGIPVLQEMSDIALGRMVEPLCDFNDTIVPESLFDLEYDKIMRVVDRGFDPNRIVSRNGMPLIFKVVNDHEAAGPLISERAKLFAKSVSFIRFLLSRGYNPNVSHKGEIVLQILAKHVPVGKRILIDRAFHKSCIEYVEYCETLTKMIHDVNAAT